MMPLGIPLQKQKQKEMLMALRNRRPYLNNKINNTKGNNYCKKHWGTVTNHYGYRDRLKKLEDQSSHVTWNINVNNIRIVGKPG